MQQIQLLFPRNPGPCDVALCCVSGDAGAVIL